ncbi:MAG: rRNA pseudouridine synthase, partial [Armatimonadetes bacterium]|nr:rRNA pseudouridine synthase [Akkermansiaceae bacterium]
MKLVKLLANLGYGSRREVEKLLKSGVVTDDVGNSLGAKDFPGVDKILVSGEKLDSPAPLVLIMNKPEGYTCSMEDPEGTIYDLLPLRFSKRNPGLNPVGRLDKETSGMLLLSDDGKFLHRVIHPKSGCLKVYHVVLDRALQGNERGIFGSGEMLLESETKPLLAAGFEAMGEKEAKVILHEGRYHQVRRMFAALGNHVTGLRRISIGGLELPKDLPEGEWRIVTEEEKAMLFGNFAGGDAPDGIDRRNYRARVGRHINTTSIKIMSIKTGDQAVDFTLVTKTAEGP